MIPEAPTSTLSASASSASASASPASSPAASSSGTSAGPSASPATTASSVIGAVTYQDSVGFTCDTYGNLANFVYDVAGYKYLTALVGVPSDATNAAGNAMTITFFKDGSTQLGQPITVSLDHPQSVHLPLQDASQLQISCNATNVTSHQPVDMDAALGNATIGPS